MGRRRNKRIKKELLTIRILCAECLSTLAINGHRVSPLLLRDTFQLLTLDSVPDVAVHMTVAYCKMLESVVNSQQGVFDQTGG